MITAHGAAPADPFEEIADILPKLAVNIGWLKLMGEARTEQKSRQRRAKEAPVSEQQAAHLERKRLARSRSKQRHRGLFETAKSYLATPRPFGRGVRVSAA